MKRLFFVVGLSLMGLVQAQLSPRLEEQLLSGPDWVQARVEFVTEVDLPVLQQKFLNQGIPVGEWPRWVNRVLMKDAASSQGEALEMLHRLGPDQLKSLRPFYIVNMIVLEARPQVLRALATLPKVSYIDLADDQFAFDEPVVHAGPPSPEAINGIEPGLAAINAPAMWKLGYTGRGRVVYNYDTGVWPTHPSYSDRFMGNYAPLSQSWYGLLRPYPDGRISDHGTHTLGTTIGLDTATNDTIGVAFGAYWIANDFVAPTVAQLPPLAQMMAAFEWALNPDGDTNTSSDVPDVINNSWRWLDDPDTVHCGGFVVNLMNAIEAAGMANVFSGGNSGPSNATVNSPQRINTSKVNTFSVGSIDGNQTFPYPISNFSTRGPTQCPGSGSLLIHPEVVAPGQNVRSAWGTDRYNTISGTSMAAPHVSGAILLLKEAFPQLSGAQLMQALYTTAIDMGPTGEDNTYGNGLIDVGAAYQHLALTHTPVNPNDISWDVAVKSIGLPATGEVTCLDSYSPAIVLENRGDSSISSLDIDVLIDGALHESISLGPAYQGLMNKGDIDTINVGRSIPLVGGGEHEVIVIVKLTQGQDYDLYNNQRIVRINKRSAISLPFIDDFEFGVASDDWYIGNPDGLSSWDSISVQGWQGNTHAAYVPLGDYLPRASQKDGLWSPVLQLPIMGQINLSFDVAYQQLGTLGLVQDTFKVYASTDCGQSFPHLLYEKHGSDLSTTGVLGVNFAPASRAEWRRETIDLSSFVGQEILLSFETVNRKGNDVFLDNISVYEGLWDPITLKEEELSRFSLYPNPAGDRLYTESNNESSTEIRIQLHDSSGRPIGVERSMLPYQAIDISDLAPGLYMLSLQKGQNKAFLKFIKN